MRDQPRHHRDHAVSLQPCAAVEFSGASAASASTTKSRASSSGSPAVCPTDEEDLERPMRNLGETSAALVYDTSVFGATSPILGQRYRRYRNRRLIDVFGRARRLPQASWRGRSLRPARHALRPIWPRQRRLANLPALHRIRIRSAATTSARSAWTSARSRRPRRARSSID